MKILSQGALVALLLTPTLAACGGQVAVPQPRSIIIYTGERIQTDGERMMAVEAWMRPQLDHIDTSPDFLIRVHRENVRRYPWDALEIDGDTAHIRVYSLTGDVDTPYLLYAHYRLAQETGDIDRWLPEEAEGLVGFDLEKAILQRIADVWLLGRSVYDTQAYGPLDELLYSAEFGYLEDFIVATQGDRFPEERERVVAEAPERAEAFSDWLYRTFERPEPGFVTDLQADLAEQAEEEEREAAEREEDIDARSDGDDPED